MKHSSIVAALQILAPTAQYTVLDGEIMWECDEPMPSLDEIEKVASLHEVRMMRLINYPPIGDQLDDLFKSGAFSPEMTEKIQSVKDAYPKEAE